MTKQEQHIITGCQKGDRKAQNLLFEQYKGMLFGVCLRYAKQESEAEDMLQEGMILIYQNLYKYRPTGSFAAWMKKVMVNSCLQVLRNKRFPVFTPIPLTYESKESEEEDFNPLSQENLLKFIQQLPDGYRMIFNLYVIEGYTHEEIGQHLGISKNTSKSQLSRAKRSLRALIESAFNDCNT